MAKIIKDKQAIDKHKAYWSKLNSEDNIDITTPELDNIYSPYSNNNPFYNGGVGTPIIQPAPNPIANGGTGAPAIQQAPTVSGIQQVIDLHNTMGNLGMQAGTDVTMQNTQLTNGEEIQAAKDLNAKRQAEYDALVPTMIQSNKDSIQKYNDENQPKQSINISPAPQTNQPQSLSDMMRPRGMEIRDSAGGFVSGTGGVRSVATPTIVSAPPPVMKDIPPTQYATTTTSIRTPDPRTGRVGPRTPTPTPTIFGVQAKADGTLSAEDIAPDNYQRTSYSSANANNVSNYLGYSKDVFRNVFGSDVVIGDKDDYEYVNPDGSNAKSKVAFSNADGFKDLLRLAKIEYAKANRGEANKYLKGTSSYSGRVFSTKAMYGVVDTKNKGTTANHGGEQEQAIRDAIRKALVGEGISFAQLAKGKGTGRNLDNAIRNNPQYIAAKSLGGDKFKRWAEAQVDALIDATYYGLQAESIGKY